MFKKLGLAIVIALAFCFAGFAKTNVNLRTEFVTAADDNEALIKQLVADVDFRNYYISYVEFANKIVETKSGQLFYKYVQNTATDAEQNLLFKQMNVENKKEFDAIAVKNNSDARRIARKFVALAQLNESEKKSILVSAFEKVALEKSIKLKVLGANPQQCFVNWTACITLCVIGCSSNNTPEAYNECMWQCTGGCTVASGICWFLAD